MVDAKTPTTYGGTGEPGLAAVRTKFGDDMVAEIRCWPMTARHYFTALHGDRHGVLDEWGQEQVAKEVRAAEQRLARAKRDKEFAVMSAEAYSRTTLLFPLGSVPTVTQYRELFGMTERDRKHDARIASEVALPTPASLRELTAKAAKALPIAMTPEELEREGQLEPYEPSPWEGRGVPQGPYDAEAHTAWLAKQPKDLE
jgi:hypothetical protein